MRFKSGTVKDLDFRVGFSIWSDIFTSLFMSHSYIYYQMIEKTKFAELFDQKVCELQFFRFSLKMDTSSMESVPNVAPMIYGNTHNGCLWAAFWKRQLQMYTVLVQLYEMILQNY